MQTPLRGTWYMDDSHPYHKSIYCHLEDKQVKAAAQRKGLFSMVKTTPGTHKDTKGWRRFEERIRANRKQAKPAINITFNP